MGMFFAARFTRRSVVHINEAISFLWLGDTVIGGAHPRQAAYAFLTMTLGHPAENTSWRDI
jgi:hypothetical protein